jgi:hypothetical protein
VWRLAALAAVVVASVGCGACNSAPAATTEFFGSSIEPPRGLAKIHPGMSVGEAKKLVPGLHEPDHKTIREELVVDSGASNVQLEVRVDGGTVSSIVAIVEGHIARDLLEHAWGQPEIERDSLGQPEVTWSSESTGWKVRLDCLERNCLVEYSPYHVLTADFFGAHVVPPGELSKLRIGMKLSEAKALAPGPVSVRAGIATEVDGVREFVAIDDRSATVRSIYLNLPPHAEELIAQAWGAGKEATEPVGKTVLVWPDQETGWRATLRAALGLSHDLAFDQYLPAEKLFGDQPDRLDGLPEPVLGHTVDDIKKAYKDELTVMIPNKELVLTLPPTEWDRFGTRIQLAVSGGKVRELSFSVPWKAHPDAQAELLELFKHKWGDPKEIEQDGKPALLFHDDDPRVEIREDTEHGAWAIVLK